MNCERHQGLDHQEFRVKRDDFVFTGVLLASETTLEGPHPTTFGIYLNCASGLYVLETVRADGEDAIRDAALFQDARVLVASLLNQGQFWTQIDEGALLRLYENVLSQAAKHDVNLAEAIMEAWPRSCDTGSSSA